MSEQLPILYSFRRCPYAMRARLAVASSKQSVELREVVLRDKPAEMLEASPKATVPVLIDTDHKVIDESRDIINWALGKNDPERWLDYSEEIICQMHALIERMDGPFKTNLDRYKYANRHEGVDGLQERDKACEFLWELNERLEGQTYLFGERFCLADGSILPFIRQFAHVDREWFWAQDWKNLIAWLDRFLVSEAFLNIMTKYPRWDSNSKGIIFPESTV